MAVGRSACVVILLAFHLADLVAGDLSIANYGLINGSVIQGNCPSFSTTSIAGVGLVNINGQTFQSPHPYANSVSCYWKIVAPASSQIMLVFNTLAWESCCDQIHVFDSAVANLNSASCTYCSTSCPCVWSTSTSPQRNIAVSTSNSLLVYMYTDSSVIYSGFIATARFFSSGIVVTIRKKIDFPIFMLYSFVYHPRPLPLLSGV